MINSKLNIKKLNWLWTFGWMMTRFMHRGWTIHLQGPSRGAQGIHLRYTDHAHIRSAICISTGVDTMVGSQIQSKSMATIPNLFHSITTLLFPVMFGLASITVMVVLLLYPVHHLLQCSWWPNIICRIFLCNFVPVKSCETFGEFSISSENFPDFPLINNSFWIGQFTCWG